MENEDSVIKLYINKYIDDKVEVLRHESAKELTSLRESIKELTEKNKILERQFYTGRLSNILRVASHKIHITGHLLPRPDLIPNVRPCEEEIKKYIGIAEEQLKNLNDSSDMEKLIVSVLNKVNNSLYKFSFNTISSVSD